MRASLIAGLALTAFVVLIFRNLQARADSLRNSALESGRQAQLEKEANLVSFLTEQGLAVYEPDLKAFREHVQGQYAGSELAASWPDGLLDKINALGN